MSNYQIVQALIAQFSGQHNTIGVPRVLCKLMGSLEGGVFLSQIIYWSDKGRDGEWFYKSYQEWEEEVLLSEYKVRKYSKKLEKIGVLEIDLRKANGAPTCHYRFDSEKFTDWILKFLGMDSEKISESITKTTTETTTNPATPPKSTTTLEDFFGPKQITPPSMSGSVETELWRDWQRNRVHPVGGVHVNELRRTGWTLEQAGFVPPATGKLTGWLQGLAECYLAAGGDQRLIAQAAEQCAAREARYVPTNPRGVAKEIKRITPRQPVVAEIPGAKYADVGEFLGGHRE